MINELSLIFLFFLILGTLVQFWLAIRQKNHVRQHQNAVPNAFAEKLSLEEHQKAAAYTLTKTSFSQKMLIIDAIIIFLWTLGGGLEILDQVWRSLKWSEFICFS